MNMDKLAKWLTSTEKKLIFGGHRVDLDVVDIEYISTYALQQIFRILE